MSLKISQDVKSLNTEVDNLKNVINSVKNEIEVDKSIRKTADTADDKTHFEGLLLNLNSSLRKTLSTSERNSQDLVGLVLRNQLLDKSQNFQKATHYGRKVSKYALKGTTNPFFVVLEAQFTGLSKLQNSYLS